MGFARQASVSAGLLTGCTVLLVHGELMLLACMEGAEGFWKTCCTPLGKKHRELNRRNLSSLDKSEPCV